MKRREGTFKLIESGEPFYPRHLSENSKDFMRKASCPLLSCSAFCFLHCAFYFVPPAFCCVDLCSVYSTPPPPSPTGTFKLSDPALPWNRTCFIKKAKHWSTKKAKHDLAFCPVPIECCPLPWPYASALCLLAFAVCCMPFAFCLLPSAFCLLPSAFCLLPSAFCLLPSAFCLLPSAFCLLR